jgi:hypothetical protein
MWLISIERRKGGAIQPRKHADIFGGCEQGQCCHKRFIEVGVKKLNRMKGRG